MITLCTIFSFFYKYKTVLKNKIYFKKGVSQDKNLVERCMCSGNVEYVRLICRQSSCCKIIIAGIREASPTVVDQLEISQNTLNYTQSS